MRQLLQKLKQKAEYKFSLYNHYKHRRIGKGTLIGKSSLGVYVSLGRNCDLYNVTLGDFSYLGKDVTVMNTRIGRFCSIGQGASIALGMHPTSSFVSTSPVFYSPNKQCGTSFSDQRYFAEMGQTVIGNDVWIGANAVILDSVCIGDGAIVGAGAIVTKDVPPYAIVVGNPAKLIRYRFSDEEIQLLLAFQWWAKEPTWLKKNFKDFHNIQTFSEKYGPHTVLRQ